MGETSGGESQGGESQGGESQGSESQGSESRASDDHELHPVEHGDASVSPPVDGAEPVAAASSPRPAKSLRAGLMGAAGGMLLGLAAGVWIGMRFAKQGAKPAAIATVDAAKPAARDIGERAAALPGGVDFDLGAMPKNLKLQGKWKTRVQIDGRNVAVMSGSAARVIVTAPLLGQDQMLSIVAKTVGTKFMDAVDVTVSAGDLELGTLALEPRWKLYALALPATAIGEQPLALSLTLSGDSAEAAVAVDQLRIGPMSKRADVILRTADGRARLLNGFHPVEGPGCDEPWAWSQGLASTVAVLLAPAAGPYQLRVHASAYGKLSPLELEVRLNGKPAGNVVLSKLGEEVLEVPEGLLTAGVNTIEFVYPRSAKPVDVEDGATDTRDLAMRLFAVAIAPRR